MQATGRRPNPRQLTPQERIDRAAEGHYYLQVDESGVKHSKLLITGAVRRWTHQYPDIYLSDYRLVGSPENVRRQLREWGINDTEIERAIRESWSRDNHGERFEEEIEQLRAYQTGQQPARKVAARAPAPVQQATQPTQQPRTQPTDRFAHFGYDVERLQDQNPEISNLITARSDQITDLLRPLIAADRILLMDKESMATFDADAIVILSDGRYLITNGR